jgi:hypothetical protein
MAIYVAEIQGKAVVAFNADSAREADEMAASEASRTDLGELENDGMPLWDGRSDISVREASPVEHGVWSISKARAIAQGDLEVRGRLDCFFGSCARPGCRSQDVAAGLAPRIALRSALKK